MKISNLFTKSRKDRVTTIESSVYEDDDLTLPEYHGMYTIKNINPVTSDDLFYFQPGVNMIPGYVDSSGVPSINLINKNKKMVKSICNSFYHSILDDMSEILHALKQYPDYELVIDVSDISKSLNSETNEWDFFHFFVKTLRDKGITVSLVELKKYDVIYMDNFTIVSFIYESGRKSSLVYELFKEKVTDPSIKPHRHVFVSRGMMGKRDSAEIEGLSYYTDERMKDHQALETVFAELGYEIIHAERFKSFQDQLDYFYSVKTIASLTGSGLTNATFMQPGGTMFEIVTPLVVSVPKPNKAKDLTNPFYVQEIHNFYKNLAYYQNLLFAAFQNPNREVDDFKKALKDNPKLKAFLDRNE